MSASHLRLFLLFAVFVVSASEILVMFEVFRYNPTELLRENANIRPIPLYNQTNTLFNAKIEFASM